MIKLIFYEIKTQDKVQQKSLVGYPEPYRTDENKLKMFNNFFFNTSAKTSNNPQL